MLLHAIDRSIDRRQFRCCSVAPVCLLLIGLLSSIADVDAPAVAADRFIAVVAEAADRCCYQSDGTGIMTNCLIRQSIRLG